MATPATYAINGVKFYCHWDNNLEGAALRLCSMVQMVTQHEDTHRGLKDNRGGLPFAFVRGNCDAEPNDANTQSADSHYDITQEGDVYMIKHFVGCKGDQRKGPVLDMPLVDFINQQHAKNESAHPNMRLKGLEPVMTVMDHNSNKPRLTTVRTAELISQQFVKESEQFTPNNPNKAGYLERALAWKPV